jgi:hypothetical protein
MSLLRMDGTVASLDPAVSITAAAGGEDDASRWRTMSLFCGAVVRECSA